MSQFHIEEVDWLHVSFVLAGDHTVGVHAEAEFHIMEQSDSGMTGNYWGYVIAINTMLRLCWQLLDESLVMALCKHVLGSKRSLRSMRTGVMKPDVGWYYLNVDRHCPSGGEVQANQ
jgi:hypothetical protein